MSLMSDVLLNDVEVRVLGSLVEKAITTPEYYPMTLNALTNACNQKSNREPVTAYTTQTVGEALNTLKEKGLARIVMGGDSRVPKYRHYFEEAYGLTPQEAAVLNVLMLRGPQTLGEVRGRAERLYAFTDLAEVEATLQALSTRDEQPLVVQLPRQPGQKDSRYAHLLAGEPAIDYSEEVAASRQTDRQRIEQLENEMEELKQQLQELQQQFTTFRRQFE